MTLALLLAASLQAATPAPSCQAAIGPLYEGTEEAALPNRIDGATIHGRDALIALRAARGDALTTITGGNFAGADLRNARLGNICFIDTNFAGANLSGADLSGSGFVRADLSGANLSRARMAGVLLRQPNLKEADATGADLSGGKMDGGWDASVENFKLDGANLSGFRFACGITISDGCPIEGEISLRGANLTGAFLSGYEKLSIWEGARIDRTEIALTQLDELATADLAGPILVRGGEAVAELSGAELRAMLPHLSFAGEAATPSFDCARAASPIEQVICRPDGGRLRALDRAVADLYRQAGPAAAASQTAWLRARDRCPADDAWCIEQGYQRRKAALVARIGPPAWARAGAAALFVAPPVGFDETFRAGPLYTRLVPVIIGAGWSHAVVRVNADGTINVSGEALGANAHSCSLGGEGLRLDPATGWYSGPQTSGADVPMPWRTQAMPVLLLWGASAEVYENGRSGEGGEQGDPRSSDYASCGARAAFSEMVRMPASEAEIARMEAQTGRN
ncbi:MAG: hypothetical protein QOG13_1769 [Sphingomonadales bacterium]|jgi:uncharacterized protein YjbI with pentapeptide repeats|nr:hypothetical protein [Sphingomonadales bacterium]